MDVDINLPFKGLKLNTVALEKMVVDVCKDINLAAQSISVVFINDNQLAEMHGTYLNDPSPTDVITFDLGDDAIEGEIYISFDMAGKQAVDFKVSLEEEVIRLIIHGLLHLAGFDDLEEDAKAEMKMHENRLVDFYALEML